MTVIKKALRVFLLYSWIMKRRLHLLAYWLKILSSRPRDTGRIAMIKGMVKDWQLRSCTQDIISDDSEFHLMILSKERSQLRDEVLLAYNHAGMTAEEYDDLMSRLGCTYIQIDLSKKS